MSLKVRLTSTKEQKKVGYRLLKKMQGLEHPRTRHEILTKRAANTHYVCLVLKHLTDYMRHSLGDISDPHVVTLIKKYLGHLERFTAEVETNCATSRPLQKGTVARLLTSHTRTFNRIVERGDQPKLNGQIGPIWEQAVVAAIVIWDNHL